MCRSSYVHPRVPDAYVEGILDEAFHQAPAVKRLSRSESAMLGVVAAPGAGAW